MVVIRHISLFVVIRHLSLNKVRIKFDSPSGTKINISSGDSVVVVVVVIRPNITLNFVQVRRQHFFWAAVEDPRRFDVGRGGEVEGVIDQGRSGARRSRSHHDGRRFQRHYQKGAAA